MENNKDIKPSHQPVTEDLQNEGRVQKEQFNELSELSLEARMNVADQIGIPVNNLGDAAATGTMQDRDNTTDGFDDKTESDSIRTDTDR